MNSKAIEYFKWMFEEGLLLEIQRRLDGVAVRLNLFTPVEKLKNEPVSGDALAPYRKDRVAGWP